MTEKQWDDMIRINLKSVYSVIHFAAPHMIKQKSGKIIPVTSTAGQRGESIPPPPHTHYGASKGGVISLVKGLSSELARHNILVNSIAPGWVATDMSNPVLTTKKGQKMAAQAIPLGRPATAEEIAGPILFLASDLANFITGEIINVNGGSVLCGWKFANQMFAKRSKKIAIVVAAFARSCLLAALSVSAPQNPDTLTPEASAAKAHQILQKLIDAYGGPTYMDVRDSDCEGRLARFGHNGELTGYTNFKDYWRYPDANRTDYSKKGVIINLYVGDKGWTLDKGGVSELSAASVADFQEQAKKDVNNLLRVRLKEPSMTVRYGGLDIVDLKTVDWVDITDSDQRNFRLAVDRSTHLLDRSVVSTQDEAMNARNVETNIFTNFQLMDGVRTAMQITTDRNGRRSSQVFFSICKYNSGLPADLFTKDCALTSASRK